MAAALFALNQVFGDCYDVSAEEVKDQKAFKEKWPKDQFIFDIQTHCIDDQAGWEQQHPGKQYNADGFAQFLTLYQCDLASRPDCIGPAPRS